MSSSSEQPYTIITADTHAGASIEAYRAYLEPQWQGEFDAWRAAYKNPSKKHLGTKKNKSWDSAERTADLERDGVVGEVLFPNTVPPFYDKAFHVSPPPSPAQYERWQAGIRAHNRWLAEFCAEAPERRAGIGLIHLNDIDAAIEDVAWIAKHGLRGGLLLPLPAPSDVHLPPLTSPHYERLWAAIEDHDLVINQHSGQGSPHYGSDPGSDALWVMEMPFFVQRGFCQLILAGVFERHPRLRYILTESGCAWAPGLLRRMDGVHMSMKAGFTGEVDFSKSFVLKESPSFYAKRNCWYGASAASPREIADRHLVGVDRICWGTDYPHYEGTYPHTRKSLRHTFHDVDPTEVRLMLGVNAARLYGFELEKLARIAHKIGPTPDEVAQPLPAAEIPRDALSMAFRS